MEVKSCSQISNIESFRAAWENRAGLSDTSQLTRTAQTAVSSPRVLPSSQKNMLILGAPCAWRLADRRFGSKFTFPPRSTPQTTGGVGYLIEVPMWRAPRFEPYEILMLATSVVLFAALIYAI